MLEKVQEMAEGVVVVDAPVFKTREEIMKKQQVNLSLPLTTHVFIAFAVRVANHVSLFYVS